jgi:hypothetical protein
VVEVGVGQQHEIDVGRIEAERLRVLIVKLAPQLKQTTVDQEAPPGTLEQVARAGDAAIGTVK